MKSKLLSTLVCEFVEAHQAYEQACKARRDAEKRLLEVNPGLRRYYANGFLVLLRIDEVEALPCESAEEST